MPKKPIPDPAISALTTSVSTTSVSTTSASTTPGSDSWWQAKQADGIPEISLPEAGASGDNLCQVTFWWRDPHGDERHSPIKKVWIYITGVTDHHQLSVPQSLIRLAGSDAWYWQTQLSAGWRGSYCLIPVTSDDDFPAAARQIPVDRAALRQGWRRLLPQAIADPFNRHSWRNARGHAVSGLHLPQAPAQPGWDNPAEDFTPPRCLWWRSQRLANERRVWLFTSGEGLCASRPLALVLDGQFWAQNMPLWGALESQTRCGALPPACYVLIDSVDNEQRSRELPCNANFWQAVIDELLPLLARELRWSADVGKTLIAGHSFGGLSALYAALHWADHFGCALCLSGSFWWPHRWQQHSPPGQLLSELADGLPGKSPLRVYLAAGTREPLIRQVNTEILSLLEQRSPQSRIFYRLFNGGHDALCWRGALMEGLRLLWVTGDALSGNELSGNALLSNELANNSFSKK